MFKRIHIFWYLHSFLSYGLARTSITSLYPTKVTVLSTAHRPIFILNHDANPRPHHNHHDNPIEQKHRTIQIPQLVPTSCVTVHTETTYFNDIYISWRSRASNQHMPNKQQTQLLRSQKVMLTQRLLVDVHVNLTVLFYRCYCMICLFDSLEVLSMLNDEVLGGLGGGMRCLNITWLSREDGEVHGMEVESI